VEGPDETEVRDIFAGRELAVTVDDGAAETEVADAVAGRELGAAETELGLADELARFKLAEPVDSEIEMLTWLSTTRTKGRSATHCCKVIQARMVTRSGASHPLSIQFKR